MTVISDDTVDNSCYHQLRIQYSVEYIELVYSLSSFHIRAVFIVQLRSSLVAKIVFHSQLHHSLCLTDRDTEVCHIHASFWRFHIVLTGHIFLPRRSPFRL